MADEHSSPIHRPESPNPRPPGSAARGFRHPSNRRSPSAAQSAGTQASPSALTVDEASGLLPAVDSTGGSGGGTGLTFVEELDLAAARLERMGSADGETRVLAQQQQQLVQERGRAEARQQPPRGSHNSRDLSAPAAWELCIKNSELTMDEDEDQIGMGGTGTVYKALWCGAPVAVKKIYYGDDHDHDPASLESLKKEADILATLRHPNIVLFLGASFAPPNIFLVSELMTGPKGHNNVRRVLDDPSLTSLLSWGLRIRMAHDISLAMHYLHSRNIVHRDLKSANVLVTSDLRCKVTDFGNSRLVDPRQAAPGARAAASSTGAGSRAIRSRHLSRPLTMKL
eukprot:COSAG02_NODE_3966_length_5976_cov_2.712949_5_plen_341_part_00